MANDFNYTTPEHLGILMDGKIVDSFAIDSDHGDECLVILFKDGSKLRIRYDYLYDWEFTEGRGIIGA